MVRVKLIQIVVVVGLLLAAGSANAVAGAESVVDYRPPVAGPVVDRFRPPVRPHGPGNRGIDYATSVGDAVAAAADGEVTFAGQVGGSLHVVVLHADGIRTSYSFLGSVAVRASQRIVQGELVGRAGVGLHFGARRGDTYVDPTALLGGEGDPPGSGGRVRLVPDGPARPMGRDDEASGLRRFLGGQSGPVVASPRTAHRPPSPSHCVGAAG